MRWLLTGVLVFSCIIFVTSCDNDSYCPEGLSWCWAQCVDLMSDEDNCGSCDNSCDSDQLCVDGRCVCQDGYANCNGTCTDTNSDAANCGECDNACEDYETCHQGICTIIDEFDSDGDGYIGEEWGGDDCDDNDPDIHPDAPEICDDDLDNDCDDSVNEGCSCQEGGARSCGSNIGNCTYGRQICIEEGGEWHWSVCQGGILPEEEVCGDWWIDNDCDGAFENGCPCVEDRTCGMHFGICEEGIQHCNQGIWGTCEGARWPEEEISDGLDNDCDGLIDENCGCQPGDIAECSNDIGECRYGIQECQEGCFFGECSGVIPAEEVCDGLDNDCDGETDEDFDLTSDPEHCGACDNACGSGESCVDGVCQ